MIITKRGAGEPLRTAWGPYWIYALAVGLALAGLLATRFLSVALWDNHRVEIVTLDNGEEVQGTVVGVNRDMLIMHRVIGRTRHVPVSVIREVRVGSPHREPIVDRFASWKGSTDKLQVHGQDVSVGDGAIDGHRWPLLPIDAHAAKAAGIERAEPVAALPSAESPVAITRETVRTENAGLEIAEYEKRSTGSRDDAVYGRGLPPPLPIEAQAAKQSYPGAVAVAAVAIAPQLVTDSPSKEVLQRPSITATALSGEEGVVELTFTLEFSRPTKRPIFLVYATINGTATAGEDYEESRGVLAIEPGTTAVDVSVPIFDDREAESEENFRLVLSADPALVYLPDRHIEAIIRDDDTIARTQF